MAFTGVILGMCARVFFPEAEYEMGLPLLLKHCLQVGVNGIVIAVGAFTEGHIYFVRK